MRTGEQLWNHGNWMLNAEYEKKRKDRKNMIRVTEPNPNDIFKFGVTTLGDDVKVYNRNSGVILFEAESYDEAQRVLREQFEAS